MPGPHRLRTTLALGAVSGVLVLTACSASDDTDQSGVSADRGLDPSQYADDYGAPAREESSYSSSASAPGAVAPVEPGPLEGTSFVDHGVSGFVDAGEDPRSTFGLDVDTGSFTVARGLLDRGVRPPAASIRAEEWVNSFDYGDEAPSDADLAVTTETGLDPSTEDGTQLVRVAVSTREVDPEDRPRAHVTLVVDRSGSMDMQERLGLVKASLAVLADELRDDDTVSVVSFDDQATPILEPTRVSDTTAILEAVERLEPGGSTNLEAGLRLGYEQARSTFEDDALNVVVLCSDGVANVGDTGPDSIVDTIAEEGSAGIRLVTVGFGMGSYNDHLMEQLADTGDGFYSYVDTFEEAERLFGTELTTTLVPVANQARAQVSFDPGSVSSYRLVGYENRAIDDDDFEDLAVDAGELGPGHHATALYEVRLAAGVRPGAEIGTAQLRWVDPEDGSARGAEAVVRSAVSGASPGPAFDLASAVADTALILKVSSDPYELAGVERRAADLVADDVPGAEELLEIIQAATRTRY